MTFSILSLLMSVAFLVDSVTQFLSPFTVVSPFIHELDLLGCLLEASRSLGTLFVISSIDHL